MPTYPLTITVTDALGAQATLPTFNLEVEVPNTGLITGANTVGDFFTTSSGNFLAVVANTTPIPMKTNGWVMRVDLSGPVTDIDETKMKVNLKRPGYDATGNPLSNANKWVDVSYGTDQLRKPTPDHTQKQQPGANSYYITLDSEIKAADSIESIEFLAGFYTVGGVPSQAFTLAGGSVGRFDSAVYEAPIVDCMEQPYTIRVATSGGSFTAEWTGNHKWARGGKPFACVKGYARNLDTNASGPVNVQATMALSPKTPAGTTPSGFRQNSYAVTIDTTGLADGNCEMRCIVYPQVGDVIFDSAVDGADFPAIGVPKGIPFYKDAAGKYSPIYAFVNYDASGIPLAAPAANTSTAGIQTNAVDLATGDTHASSYQSIAAAAAAAAAWNNNAANRPGQTHNDSAGLQIILRPVTGSALGVNTGAYSGRATTSTPTGPLALQIRSPNGQQNNAVRIRSINYDGSGAGNAINHASKFWAPKLTHLKGITLDSSGLAANNDNGVLNMGGNVTALASVPHLMLEDCRVEGWALNPGGSTVVVIYKSGYRYDLRVRGNNDLQYQQLNDLSGHRLSIGSLYDNAPGIGLTTLASWYRYSTLTPLTAGDDPATLTTLAKSWRPQMQKLIMNSRFDGQAGGSALFLLSAPWKAVGVVNMIARKYAATNTNGNGMWNDGNPWQAKNVAVQNISLDAGYDPAQAPQKPYANGRLNFDYCDKWLSGLGITRNLSLSACALPEYNSKDDTHQASQNITASAIAANTTYWAGDMVHDGAGTPSYYWSLQDQVSSATPTTDLADSAKWFPLGQVGGQGVTNHPMRTANWKGQYNVDRMFNAITQDNNNQRAPGPGGVWLGEVPGRGTLYNANYDNFWVDQSGGAFGTGFTDWGDYTPKATGPLIDRVPVGREFTSHDMFGNVRDRSAGAISANNIIQNVA